ncbi:TetR/AcrR family transcriptional regulator [Asanoa sp. NPDC049518]|uniref:TetR/AcrR family transcriptional regulator n=1 Tax=unclassified Asanoa TaxID=2685164 RepID=UPI0034222B78
MCDEPLRDRLVRVGVELLEQEGLPALTLREIARRAGVSHGAPRRYFPTHLELLSAIARAGFAQLEVAVRPRPGDGPRAQLATLARGYLAFARANPGMFALMFRHDLLASGHLGLRETSLPLFDRLVDLVAGVGTRSAAPPRVVAGALWANLHGIAQLGGWGSLQLATGEDDPEPLVSAALDAYVRG